jgi:hypothetical protein
VTASTPQYAATQEALAEWIHAQECADDDCEGGDMAHYDWLAAALLAPGGPLRAVDEVKAEAWDEGANAELGRSRAITQEVDRYDVEHPKNPYRRAASTDRTPSSFSTEGEDR